MDFDEYEYLEKTVENPDLSKEAERPTSNGREEKSQRHSGSKGRDEHGSRDVERPSKRSRADEDRERHRDRDSSRHRSSPDQKARDTEREEKERRRSSRDERNGKDREREKGRDRDVVREKDRDREKGRDGEREKERDGEKEKERDRERERSRRSHSRSERHRDEETERIREKSRDREHRERELERDLRDRDREGRRYKDKKEEGEPEADPERDQRTVFAYQINLKADERDVYEFFSRAGKVRDVKLIMDRNSRRSKGVGYIEFYDAMSVPMAIALTGQKLLGQAVMVKPSEAEKNLVQSTAASGGAAGAQAIGARKLYVGNLHFNMTDEQLRQVFEPFGAVELVQLPLDPETGHCKGFGFIQFARLEDAKAAQSLNGQLEIAGRTIKVSAVTDQIGGMQDLGTNAGDLDDDEGGGLALNARSRALLMQKLDRSGTATGVASTLATPVVSNPALPLSTASVLGIPPLVAGAVQPPLSALIGMPGVGLSAATNAPAIDPIGVPSECLLLKNMFDPSIETEPEFDLDIKEDVQDECSKFGTLKHIFVDKYSAGFVYLRFDNTAAAASAQRALHGRWFAGKMITATYMLPQNYDAKFPGNSS